MKRSQKNRKQSVEDELALWRVNHEKLMRDLAELAGGYSGRTRYLILCAAGVIAQYKSKEKSLAHEEHLKAANPLLEISEEKKDAPQARTLNIKMPGVQS